MSFLRKKYIGSDSESDSDSKFKPVKKSVKKPVDKSDTESDTESDSDDSIKPIPSKYSKPNKSTKNTESEKKETVKKESVKKESAKKESGKKESVKKEKVKKETVKKEPVKKEPVKKETGKKIPVKDISETESESETELEKESESETETESEPDSIAQNIKSSVKTKLSDQDLNLEYNKMLKKYWGYDSLKPTQFEIIKKMLVNKKDVCAILATGFGKSVCYQLPCLISGKSVIVVSPLIALMHEQGLEMENKKIPVAVFNSESSSKHKNELKKEILKGNNKIIYMTPEYLIKSEEFVKELGDNLAFVCIDEAHAVSTWGLDFRPGYTKLGVIREWVEDIPILTLTATASTKVRADIVSILNLSNPELIVGDFDRPNLLIRVQRRYDDIMLNISSLLNKYSNEYIIIYCKTRDETEELSNKIKTILGIKCGCYHAGMSDIDRQLTQQEFIDGTIKCIIATIAFGMGINIPNVRLVIHYNCPKNIESYYQEIGRAGRDGKPSECVLFYSEKDFKVNRFFLQSITNTTQKEYQEKQIRQIEKYVYYTECRRKVILENFGQKMESCTNCDNCIGKLKNAPKVELSDYTVPVLMVLNILSKINDKFGSGMVINILTGKKSKVKEWMENYPEYGSGNIYGGEKWWKDLMRHMMNDDLIQEIQVTRAFFSTLSFTKKGSVVRTNLSNKFTNYSSIDIVSNKIKAGNNSESDSDCNFYLKNQIKYPTIPPDVVKKTKKNTNTKVYSVGNVLNSNNSTKPTNSTNQTKTTKQKINRSAKNTQVETNQDTNLEDELDELIGSSRSRIKKKFGINTGSDSDSD